MGLEWAKILLKNRVDVVLLGQDESALHKAQKELEMLETEQTVEILSIDITDEQALKTTLLKFLEHTQIDILINNAGVVQRGAFLEVSMEKHRAVMEVNILGMMSLTHIVLQGMVQRNSGYVVNIASMAGLTGVPHIASYVASKWAVIGFTESLRIEMQELSKNGIRFMTFCPSYVRTGMFSGAKPPLFSKWLRPQDTVKKAFDGLIHGKTLVIDPDIAQIIPLARTLLPTLVYDKVWKTLGINKSAGQKC